MQQYPLTLPTPLSPIFSTYCIPFLSSTPTIICIETKSYSPSACHLGRNCYTYKTKASELG